MKLDVRFTSNTQDLEVVFTSNKQDLEVTFTSNEQNFVADMGEVQIVTKYLGGDVYDGEYDVTPKVGAQTMPTKGKVLVNDVTINPIPFFNVSNTSGGSTAYIGSEV